MLQITCPQHETSMKTAVRIILIGIGLIIAAILAIILEIPVKIATGKYCLGPIFNEPEGS